MLLAQRSFIVLFRMTLLQQWVCLTSLELVFGERGVCRCSSWHIKWKPPLMWSKSWLQCKISLLIPLMELFNTSGSNKEDIHGLCCMVLRCGLCLLIQIGESRILRTSEEAALDLIQGTQNQWLGMAHSCCPHGTSGKLLTSVKQHKLVWFCYVTWHKTQRLSFRVPWREVDTEVNRTTGWQTCRSRLVISCRACSPILKAGFSGESC